MKALPAKGSRHMSVAAARAAIEWVCDQAAGSRVTARTGFAVRGVMCFGLLGMVLGKAVILACRGGRKDT